MKYKIFIFLAILIVFLSIGVCHNVRVNKFKTEGKLAVATVSSYNLPGKGSPSLSYYFLVKGIQYEFFYLSDEFKRDSIQKLVNKKIPVIFISSDPSRCDLLVSPDDYHRYSETMPDSMRWILSYLK